MIPTGADIECDFEMSDSGTIYLGASVPCIGASFRNRNFYSRHQVDLTDIDSIAEAGRDVLERIEDMAEKVDDPKLADAKKKAEKAANIDSQPQCEPEELLKANEELLSAKTLISEARQANLRPIRQMDLDNCVQFFDEVVRQYARPAEEQAFDNLTRTAQRAIDNNDPDFDNQIDEMRSKNTLILLRQEWFVVDWYQRLTSTPSNFIDMSKFNELKQLGDTALSNDDIDQLRQILFELLAIQIRSDSGDGMFDIANIVKG